MSLTRIALSFCISLPLLYAVTSRVEAAKERATAAVSSETEVVRPHTLDRLLKERARAAEQARLLAKR